MAALGYFSEPGSDILHCNSDDRKRLVPRPFAGLEPDLSSGYRENLGNEVDQGLIRGAFERRRGQRDAHTAFRIHGHRIA